MTSISRSFRQLAANLGRVGPKTDVFTSPQTVQPTLDADSYAPNPWYGVGIDLVAGGIGDGNYVTLQPARNSVLSPLYIQNIHPIAIPIITFYCFNKSYIQGAVADAHRMSDFTGGASTTLVRYGDTTPFTEIPAFPVRYLVLRAGIIELPPIVGESVVFMQDTVLNQDLRINLWWSERRQAA